MLAAQSPRAIWRKQMLRVQSIARRSVAPFCQGGRLQTHPKTNPVASLTLLESKRQNRIIQSSVAAAIMMPRVNLSRQRSVDALAPARGRQRSVPKRPSYARFFSRIIEVNRSNRYRLSRGPVYATGSDSTENTG